MFNKAFKKRHNIKSKNTCRTPKKESPLINPANKSGKEFIRSPKRILTDRIRRRNKPSEIISKTLFDNSTKK